MNHGNIVCTIILLVIPHNALHFILISFSSFLSSLLLLFHTRSLNITFLMSFLFLQALLSISIAVTFSAPFGLPRSCLNILLCCFCFFFSFCCLSFSSFCCCFNSFRCARNKGNFLCLPNSCHIVVQHHPYS